MLTGLDSVIRDVWADEYMTRGMPEGTTFEYGIEPDHVWAKLVSPKRVTTRWIGMDTLRNVSTAAHQIDKVLSGLRQAHYWLFAIEAQMQADPSWCGG